MPVGCRADQFQCVDGFCIEAFKKCDGRWDCEEGEDEENCGTLAGCTALTPESGTHKCEIMRPKLYKIVLHFYKLCIDLHQLCKYFTNSVLLWYFTLQISVQLSLIVQGIENLHMKSGIF